MKFKRISAVFIAVFLVFNIVGCNGTVADNSSETSSVVESVNRKNYLTLLYSMSDSFNPYTVKTAINRQLCQLIYEPLVKLNNNFEPIYCIAKEVTVEGAVCTVKLNNHIFSDGSTVTADDVVYSYNLAKNSATAYSAKLYEVKSASAVDSATVVFNLIKVDPYFINILTFPIIK